MGVLLIWVLVLSFSRAFGLDCGFGGWLFFWWSVFFLFIVGFFYFLFGF